MFEKKIMGPLETNVVIQSWPGKGSDQLILDDFTYVTYIYVPKNKLLCYVMYIVSSTRQGYMLQGQKEQNIIRTLNLSCFHRFAYPFVQKALNSPWRKVQYR